tara:strand:+ start:411 stop:632 length:222 start_codon:yes stop_codon:yes gene_type:complete
MIKLENSSGIKNLQGNLFFYSSYCINEHGTKNFLIGRKLISAIFIHAIPGKLINPERTIGVISNRSIPQFYLH